ncbi:iron-containing alcohol dehydrogenase [Citrobacter freundii]|uniref:iron-containing alcohol dehydrogenase n=1 Tax=Citrobacter freundii TaxID=546 RepID=UPI001EF0EB43|nr:iron-containing alcohol dehydrogenase [Citrobacter freundii]
MSENFIVPRRIYHGIGSFSKLETLQGNRALIVTGKGSMARLGYIEQACVLLGKNGIDTHVFDGVEADPSIETVMRGTEVMASFKPDIIIGLGGCSAIDAAKAMWIFYENPDINFEDIIKPFTIPPLHNKSIFVAIPSTSGTGTEATCVAVITDRNKGTKYPLVSYELCPDIAIVDGALCVSMPPSVTANTGLDALTHALEAYVTPLADSYTDALAERAVKDIFNTLPLAFTEGKNLQFRQTMHDASCLAGMSFTNALLGIVHSLAHQIGGTFGIAHGRANAILLPNVIRYNAKIAYEKYLVLATLLGEETVEQLATRIESLRRDVHVQDSFLEYGINESDWKQKVQQMAENAMNDACTSCNPRKPDINDMVKILNLCFVGEKYTD